MNLQKFISGFFPKTPKTWNPPKNPNESGHEYPNYTLWQTRDGSVPLRCDSTKGNETVSIEHRSGSRLTFLPNGGTMMVSGYGETKITYGASRTIVTGAQDTTIRGDSSCRTSGNCRVTNENDCEIVTNGKYVNAVAGSHNMVVGEHLDIASQSAALMTQNGITMECGNGPISITSKAAATLISNGSGSAGIASKSGSVTATAATDVAIKGGSGIHMKGGGGEIVCSDGKVFINCGVAKDPGDVFIKEAGNRDQSTMGMG